jgi:uncharacterized protein YggE
MHLINKQKSKWLSIAASATLILSATALGNPSGKGSNFQTDENGFAKAPAEFSGFTISATTHCAPTATLANQSIRDLVGRIEVVLKDFADPNVEEGIQAFPGATVQGELTKYENHVTVKICEGWRATHSFFFKLSDISQLARFQDEILELNPAGNPRERVDLSAPRPGIFSKTYEALVDTALKDAHQKAMRRAKVLLEDMPQFTNVRLTKVNSSKNPAGSVAYDQTGLGGDVSLSALSSVTVSITRSFQFELVP